MNSREMLLVLALVSAFAAPACSRKESSGSERGPGAASSAESTTGLAAWEPFDKAFTGCEGG